MTISDYLLIAVMAALFIAALPIWPHSRKWAYGPSGLIALGLFIMIVVVGVSRLNA